MFKFTKNIASLFLILVILQSSGLDFISFVSQKIECEVTMDCCTIDTSPSHSCCCDIEVGDSREDSTKIIIDNVRNNFLAFSLAKTCYFYLPNSKKAKDSIILDCSSNSPPRIIQNILSFIYFNSLPLS